MPELGALIARGRTADVHAWSPGQVLKLYRPEIDLASVEQEALVARLAHAADAPTPAVGEIVVVAGRFGLAYEQIEGIPMSEVLLRQPWRAVALGKRLARLHVQVHALAVSEALPSQYVLLVSKIERADGLSKQARQAALTWLVDARQGSQLCHGDFHPGNVLLGTRRDTVIDWTDASIGQPMADVARTLTILMGEAQPASGQSAATRRTLRRFYRAYLMEYLARADVKLTTLDVWRSINAAARLSEGVDWLAPWLLAQTLKLEANVCQPGGRNMNL